MRGQVPWLSLFFGAALASAGTFPVNPDGSGQYPTIQAAIDAAAQGDTVLCAPGTYIGTGNENLSLRGKNLSVIGAAGSAATLIHCMGNGRGFYIYENETPAALIQGFRIMAGDPPNPQSAAGGAIRIQNASPTLSDLILETCHTDTWGGGLYLYASSSAVTDLVVRGNSATGFGGGIALNGSNASIVRALVIDNTAEDHGGGIYAVDSHLAMEQVTLAGNATVESGGGLYIAAGDFEMQASLIALNNSVAGGIYGGSGSSASTLICCDVALNAGGDYAGQIADPTGTGGNLSEDPRFCGPDSGDFRLDVSSPCLPANNACGMQMGALGQGCANPYFLISGRISDNFAAPLAGVRLEGAPGLILTNEMGDYALEVPAGWSGTLRPVARGYLFEPPERSYPLVTTDLPGQDYTGAHPTPLYVPEDCATIQEAVDRSLPGDTVYVAPGTYTGEGNRNIDFGGIDLVLIGIAGPDSTILDVSEGSPCSDFGCKGFWLHSGETRAAVISGFRIQDGYVHEPGGAAVLIQGASPTLVNLKLWNNNAEPMWYLGGGAICSINGSPLIRDVLVEGSHESGILIQGGTPHLIDVTVKDCNGDYYGSGGGINCIGTAALLEGVTIQECWTYWGQGGGMAITGSPAPTLINVLIEDCSSIPDYLVGGHGGGIYCIGSSPTLQGVVFRRNLSWGGGGMYCADGSPTLEDVVFSDNHAEHGAGLDLSNCSPTLRNVTFDRCGNEWLWGEPDGPGGAIYCANGSSPELINCIVALSTAGPGIHADAGSAPTLACCDIYGNAGGPFAGSVPDWIGIDGNFAADPLYCGDENPAVPLSPAAGSPCAPPNNGCGVLIGALPVGCDNAAYLITGRVSDAGGSPIAGVEMPGFFPRLITDEEGAYSLWRLEGWTGVLQPRLPGFIFDPVLREYAELSGHQPDQDFSGERKTLHHVPAEHPDLREAFAAVLEGDTILVAPGTYSGAANVNLDYGGRDLVVLSEAGAESTLIDCQDSARAFSFGNGEGAGAVLEGFTLANGAGLSGAGDTSGGTISILSASPTIRRLRITGSDGLHGGGILLRESSALLDEIVLSGCSSRRDGAAIYVRGGSPILRHLTALDNQAGWGGGGLACDYAASPVVEHCIFYSNTASEGGGIFCRDAASSPQIQCSDVFANTMLDGLPGDFGGHAVDLTGADGNIKADPLFCDPAGGDLRLNVSSLCLAPASGCSEDMGAFGQGCEEAIFTIGGTARDSEGQALAGVRIEGYRHLIFTSELGAYAQPVFAGWSGTLVPHLRGYRFEPDHREYTGVMSELPSEDYSGSRRTLYRVPSEFATLQVGLDAAAAGDTVLVAPGLYTGSGNKNLDWLGHDLRLISEAGPAETLIDCEGAGRGAYFHFNESASALLSGFTIQGGDPTGDIIQGDRGGAIHVWGSSPTLRDLVLRDNKSGYHGGGIYVLNGSPVIEDVVVAGNRATGLWAYGGGVYFENANPIVTGALIINNQAGFSGGGIGCTNASPVLTSVTLAGNSTAHVGGGLELRNSSAPTMHGCLLAFNSANTGGGIYVTDSGCVPAISCSDLFGNDGGDWSGYGSYPGGVSGNIMADPMFCDLDAGDLTVADLSPCLPENNDCGTMIGCLGQGCILTHAADEDLPRAFSLAQNHPNPFNPVTTIRLGLPRAEQVTLRIFSVSGRCVAVPLDRAPLEAGYHDLLWRGVDERGRELASGIYLYRLEAGEFRETKKMTLLR